MNYTATLTIQEATPALEQALRVADRTTRGKSETVTKMTGNTLTITATATTAPTLRASLNATLQALTVAEKVTEVLA